MVTLLAGLLALQSVSITLGAPQQPDTTKPKREAEARRDSARAPRRVPVTAAHLATAFRSAGARELLARARVARMAHDSTLLAYDARAVTRISAGLGVRKLGRERLLFRHEKAARVRWQRDRGAWVDVTGSRTAVPAIPEARAEVEDDDDISGFTSIPYFPGREALWVGGGLAKREVNEREIVHPLAEGAEAYYTYTLGDTIEFRLSDAKEIRLVELVVSAREPRWNLVVGSFWFDAASAQLVRAAYRLSVPMDIVEVAAAEDDGDDDDIPRWLRPMTATIRGITIEYGLHEGRWWLPRLQVAEGEAQVSVMRVPFKLQESFRYASVNGRDTLPTFPVIASADSAAGDSAAADSAANVSGTRDDGDARLHVETRHDGALRIVTRVPKDTAALARSPDLPSSIFDDGDVLFGRRDADELMKELDLGLQADWAPQAPTLHYGLEQGLLRYNRVEGVSAGVASEMVLGKGYTASGMARVGVADWEPNGELALRRSDGSRTLGVGAYRRLAVADDWGAPLGLGASLNALLFARDEGLYYRAGGAELTAAWERGTPVTARLFVERQWRANVETQWSVAKALNDVRFRPNIVAQTGTIAGAALRARGSHGLDPRGWRLLSDLRLEGGVGTFDFARAAAEGTLSRGLPWRLEGALTLGGGWSGGHLPVQRLWYLGGSHSVRGQPMASAAGDAFWLARAELGRTMPAVRPSIFYDAGWAGSRELWRHPGRPLSGAGIGASILDGLVRFDISKGIRPDRGVRTDLYLEARF